MVFLSRLIIFIYKSFDCQAKYFFTIFGVIINLQSQINLRHKEEALTTQMSLRTDSIKKEEFDEIIGKAFIKGEVFYLIKWHNSAASEASWQKTALLNYGEPEIMRRQFNASIKGQPFPYIAKSYKQHSAKFLQALEDLKSGLQPKKTIERVLGKEKRGQQMYFLIQWKDDPILNAVWEPRYKIERYSETLKKFIKDTRWFDPPYIEDAYIEAVRINQRKNGIGKKEQLAIKKETKLKIQSQKVKKQSKKVQVKQQENDITVQINSEEENESIQIEEEKSKKNNKCKISAENKTKSPEKSKKKQKKQKKALLNNIEEKVVKLEEGTATRTTRNKSKSLSGSSGVQNKQKQIVKIIQEEQSQQNSQQQKEISKPEIKKKAKSPNAVAENIITPIIIKKVSFIKKLKERSGFQDQNLFLVTFTDDSTKQMLASELKGEYPEVYVNYLQKICEMYHCFD